MMLVLREQHRQEVVKGSFKNPIIKAKKNKNLKTDSVFEEEDAS